MTNGRNGNMNGLVPAVRACEVTVCARGKPLLRDVSFTCLPGEWTLVHGPSGAGKSTLLRSINGLHALTQGFIETLGTRIPGRNSREARAAWRRTGTVQQELALFETRTALQNVELGARAAGLDPVAARALAMVWLERLKVADKAHEYPARLSVGQRQRVALARAFIVRPALLLLDEPTSALDAQTARVVLGVLAEMVQRGATVIMSSHRIDEVAGLCDQRIALEGGRVSGIEQVTKVPLLRADGATHNGRRVYAEKYLAE